MADMRTETDSLGVVAVPADRLWGAQTQRSLEHFSIGQDLMPREMVAAYATLKKACAIANHAGKRLDDQRYKLIVQVCDEILAGRHDDMFPLLVWMTGSGTQFNMNVNEVISNRAAASSPARRWAATAPVHPNDHSQHGAVVQRQLSVGGVRRCGGQWEGPPHPGRDRAARRECREGKSVGRHRQNRPHAHAGRDAVDLGAGVVRLRCDAVRQSGADRGRAARRVPASARRHGGGYRHQFSAWLR